MHATIAARLSGLVVFGWGCCVPLYAERVIISLNGTWQIEESQRVGAHPGVLPPDPPTGTDF